MNKQFETGLDLDSCAERQETVGLARLTTASADEAFGQYGPTLFRIAWLYLLLPSVLVLVTFERRETAVAVALAALLSCIGALRWTAPPSGAQCCVTLLATWPFLAVSAGILWLSGILPPFGPNSDWLKHYALFNELIDQSWPPVVPASDGLATLRYSLSYYVAPALVAKYFGTGWLGISTFLWSCFGLYLALVLAFGAHAWPIRMRFTICLVFLLFSGADIVGKYLTGAPQDTPMHFEWWARFGQLSSNVTSLFWTPQHAIPAWIATFMILRYPQRALRAGGVLTAVVAMWSPFSALGLLPLFIWAGAKVGLRHAFSWINLLTAPVLLLAAFLFLTRGASGAIPFGFVSAANGFKFSYWLAFVGLEILVPALALLLVSPRSTQLILPATGFLLLLSLFTGGANNDLLMRSSLPMLALMALLAAVAIACAPNDLRKAPLVLCLVAGLATPLGEIMRSLLTPRIAAMRESRIPDIVGGRARPLEQQYLVPLAPDRLTQTSIAGLAEMRLMPFGSAIIDDARYRIVSSRFADAGLVSREIHLPAGFYRIDATLSWNVTASQPGMNGGHLSLHGKRLLAPLSGSAVSRKVSVFFRTNGEPFQIAVGLGGWSSGMGYVQVHELQLLALHFSPAP